MMRSQKRKKYLEFGTTLPSHNELDQPGPTLGQDHSGNEIARPASGELDHSGDELAHPASDALDHSGGYLDQPGDEHDQSGDELDQSADEPDLSGDGLDQPGDRPASRRFPYFCPANPYLDRKCPAVFKDGDTMRAHALAFHDILEPQPMRCSCARLKLSTNDACH